MKRELLLTDSSGGNTHTIRATRGAAGQCTSRGSDGEIGKHFHCGLHRKGQVRWERQTTLQLEQLPKVLDSRPSLVAWILPWGDRQIDSNQVRGHMGLEGCKQFFFANSSDYPFLGRSRLSRVSVTTCQASEHTKKLCLTQHISGFVCVCVCVTFPVL